MSILVMRLSQMTMFQLLSIPFEPHIELEQFRSNPFTNAHRIPSDNSFYTIQTLYNYTGVAKKIVLDHKTHVLPVNRHFPAL